MSERDCLEFVDVERYTDKEIVEVRYSLLENLQFRTDNTKNELDKWKVSGKPPINLDEYDKRTDEISKQLDKVLSELDKRMAAK